MISADLLFNIGIALIILGFIIIIFGLLASSRSGVRGGGIILIGPFPIVFGTDRATLKWMLPLIIIAIALFIIFMVLPYVGFMWGTKQMVICYRLMFQ